MRVSDIKFYQNLTRDSGVEEKYPKTMCPTAARETRIAELQGRKDCYGQS
jgi:hypothetical protein